MVKDDAVHGYDGDVCGPPPMSTIMLPVGSEMGRSARPRRSSLLHEIDFGRLGPHGHVLDGAAFDWVMPVGMPMTMRGRSQKPRLFVAS